MSAHFQFRSGFIPPSQRQINEAVEQCAELMSCDLPLRDIAARMELSVGTICVLFHLVGECVGEMPS